MKCKKLITLALAGVMTLSMAAVPGMAASETVIKGAFEPITIDVVVMPTGKAQLNPYSMPVKAMDTQATPAQIGTSTLNTAGQIATQPLAMYNKTDVDLSVGATVSAENVSSSLELVSRSIAASVTDKQALVYLEAKQDRTLTATDAGQAAGAGVIGDLNGANLVAAFNAWDATSYNKTDASQILVNAGEATTKKNIAIMDAGTGSAPNAGGFVLYRLGGECTAEPETAWAASDKFDIKVAFSFTPIKYEVLSGADGGTVALGSATISRNGNTTATYAVPSGVTLSSDAVYAWSMTGTDAANFTITGSGTNVTVTHAGTSGDTADVKLVITDGLVKYEPAVQTITVS